MALTAPFFSPPALSHVREFRLSQMALSAQFFSPPALSHVREFRFASASHPRSQLNRSRLRAVKEKIEETGGTQSPTSSSSSSPAEEVTEKFGLEVGLWNIFSSRGENNGEEGAQWKTKGDQAKELLAKYGGAYLATSITLSIVSFALCYALISAGVDVQALLHKVGISIDETGEKVGTFALAYAAHKAASPIRFPPTVALTPIVARWIGKKVQADE